MRRLSVPSALQVMMVCQCNVILFIPVLVAQHGAQLAKSESKKNQLLRIHSDNFVIYTVDLFGLYTTVKPINSTQWHEVPLEAHPIQ